MIANGDVIVLTKCEVNKENYVCVCLSRKEWLSTSNYTVYMIHTTYIWIIVLV